MKKKFLISLLVVITILSAIISTVYATEENNTDIPSNYDLRNDIEIKVENQGQTGWCAAYSELKMIETYIQRTTGLNYDLSEGYSTHWETFGGTYGKHVLESDFPTKEYELTETNQKKFDEATSKAVVENFEYEMTINKDVETIKRYIMNYGGAFASTSCDRQWHKYKGGIYHKEKLTDFTDYHGVIIIGWDDNYSKDNFYYEKPENDGAWLVLNSWGTDWANNGTAWVSYEDICNLTTNCYGVKSVTLINGEKIETKLGNDEEQKEQIAEIPVIENDNTDNQLRNSETFTIIIQTSAILLVLVIFIYLVIRIKNRKKNK